MMSGRKDAFFADISAANLYRLISLDL